MTKITFVSDLHLTPENQKSMRRFRKFAAKIAGNTQQLYILGDLFEFWIGDDGADLLGHIEAENLLKTISNSGVELFLIPGNRDFLIGDKFSERTGCQILTDPSVITIGAEQVLLTHGDSLCTDDVEHQLARQQMLSSKWKIAFLNMPIQERMDTAINLRKKSEKTKRHKSMEIMDINQNSLENFMRDHNVLTVIHGHTHRPAVHEFILDGRNARRFVLGDWDSQESILWYHKNKYIFEK